MASHPGTLPAVGPYDAPPSRRGPVRRLARRLWRRVRYLVEPPTLRVVYDPGYEKALWGVPLDPLRADRVLAFLANEGLLRREELSRPQPASMRNILAVHTPGYVESLQRTATLAGILGTPTDEKEAEGAVDHQRLVCGGTIQATRIALALGCTAVNFGGGLHHAGRERGMGFCIFNDVAIAVRRLRRRGFTDRILIVDLDLHDGNGTREIFAEDDSVHTFSIHNDHWGSPDAIESTAIALGPDVEDDRFLATLVKSLPPVFEQFRPRFVVYIAGCDGAVDDGIGNWRLTAEAILARDRLVTDLARHHQSRLVAVLGGGYGEHAWRYTARYAAWLLTGKTLEPPPNRELTLVRFRQLRERLMVESGESEQTSGAFTLTEEDLAGILPGVPRQTRFLGRFSQVGVEVMLERTGILQQLRAKGFRQPSIGLDLDHPVGHTLRIWADPDRTALLVELRVARSAHEMAGFSVLVIEWLLLQDPHGAFANERSPLPGQRHPGLGMLNEFFAWLVLLCEDLGLDGLSFHVSHYHIAALGRRVARFVDPANEALFRAVAAISHDRTLGEISQLLEDGAVVDERTGRPVSWSGFAMVLPVSEALRARVEGDGYRAEVEAEEAGLRLRIAEPASTG